MVDRRKKAQPTSLQGLRAQLAIDRDNLDKSLEEQPELYYHVAQAHAHAIAEADETKLDRDQGLAKFDREIREALDDEGERITENLISQRMHVMPEARELRLARYKALEKVADWQALKDAYHQRSFMLRELVGMYIASRHDAAMAGGSAESRGRISDAEYERLAVARKKRRGAGESQ